MTEKAKGTWCPVIKDSCKGSHCVCYTESSLAHNYCTFTGADLPKEDE